MLDDARIPDKDATSRTNEHAATAYINRILQTKGSPGTDIIKNAFVFIRYASTFISAPASTSYICVVFPLESGSC